MNKKIFTVFILITLGFATYFIIKKLYGSSEVTLANLSFKIPPEFILQSTSRTAMNNLDSGNNSLLIKLPAGYLGENIKGYRTKNEGYIEDVELILTVLSEEEKSRYESNSKYIDLWYKKNSYSNRKVEETKYGYKVFRSTKYKYSKRSWELLSLAPSGDIPRNINDFWLASCLEVKTPITKSGKNVLCDSYVIVDNIAVDFTISLNNMDSIESIKEFLKSRIKKWRVK